MVTGVRSKTAVFTSLANVQLWLAEHQGAEVRLPGSRLHVGLPVAAARAVVCTIWLMGPGSGPAPLLAGRVRALVNPHSGAVRLDFSGCASPALLAAGAVTSEHVRREGERVAHSLLELVAQACEGARALSA